MGALVSRSPHFPFSSFSCCWMVLLACLVWYVQRSFQPPLFSLPPLLIWIPNPPIPICKSKWSLYTTQYMAATGAHFQVPIIRARVHTIRFGLSQCERAKSASPHKQLVKVGCLRVISKDTDAFETKRIATLKVVMSQFYKVAQTSQPSNNSTGACHLHFLPVFQSNSLACEGTSPDTEVALLKAASSPLMFRYSPILDGYLLYFYRNILIYHDIFSLNDY